MSDAYSTGKGFVIRTLSFLVALWFPAGLLERRGTTEMISREYLLPGMAGVRVTSILTGEANIDWKDLKTHSCLRVFLRFQKSTVPCKGTAGQALSA